MWRYSFIVYYVAGNELDIYLFFMFFSDFVGEVLCFLIYKWRVEVERDEERDLYRRLVYN